jgi:squalene-associated FAD-dependent desaturase
VAQAGTVPPGSARGRRDGGRPRVVVCGGGLAGVAAACEAALRGAEVTLVERRPFLGGKAFSFTDPDAGVEVDNGQHVFLGCCTAYRDLLRLLGTEELTTIQPALDAPVRDRAGRAGALRAARLPAPLHLGPSFLAYPHLSAREKAAALPALLALGALRPAARARLDGTTFAEWLGAHGQSEGAIARFWDLIVVPTCNDPSARVSAALAAFVFQEGFFRTRLGSAIGYARVGLTRLVDPAARALLAGRGGRTLSGRAATEVDGGGVRLGDGERLPADAVVLALPPGRVREVAPGALLRDPDLGASPIVNVHLWYDRPVMEGRFTAVLGSPAQWVFNRTAMGSSPGPGQHLAISVSGARTEVTRPKAELVDGFATEIAALFPAARAARLERALVVKEPEATFAAEPGQAARRPGPETPLPGVYLAGAWTDTGWPATMESAVRSGIRAARLATGVRPNARRA